MSQIGDWFVFLVVILLLLWWLWFQFARWLHAPPSLRLRRLMQDGSVERDEQVEWLEACGYEVLSGKHRIPLGVAVDEGPMQATRLYFDYLVQKEELYYLVKMDRARKPIEWTASGLRERLLAYALLFPECEGIIIADPKGQSIHTVRFKVEDEDG
ncbi:hypothetical protein [Cohnella thailandensis]|uniref:Uncharacterized protein n=1 Tax=Cohnella thailandensis TaxID=557557 RepID=A0A841SY33_9BACL|nr:hypothetical protein [Cohnella thailandensis]MBB6635516.1 hypothetical protein [Cohnella thailandensis]MBP1974896.1 hypothetical protein [Cohnella thailandensis]